MTEQEAEVRNPPRRLHIPVPLRWGDLDAYGHVNNTSLLKILEEARIRAFWRPQPGEDAPETAILEGGQSRTLMAVVARQQIEYFAPIPYQRAPLDIQIWFGNLGGSSIEVCYEVFADSVAEPKYARSTVLLVLVDQESGRPRRLTPQMREVWGRYRGPAISYTR